MTHALPSAATARFGWSTVSSPRICLGLYCEIIRGLMKGDGGFIPPTLVRGFFPYISPNDYIYANKLTKPAILLTSPQMPDLETMTRTQPPRVWVLTTVKLGDNA